MPADGPGLTAGVRRDAAVLAIRAALAAGGIAEAHSEARRLVVRALALSAEALVMSPETALTASQAETLRVWCARRVQREPLGRIAGEREFYGRPFQLSPATLEPRPDSETLIEATLSVLADHGKQPDPLRIIDIGTGSGCLLLTLLAELPAATGLGTDISADALATAQTNAVRLGLADRVAWRATSGLEGIAGPFDVLVSNPPYIPASDIAALEPEVRCYDPRAALDGGTDGLDVYRALARELVRVVPDGIAVLEFGAGQAADVIGIFTGASSALELIGVWRDLGGHERCVAFRTLCKR